MAESRDLGKQWRVIATASPVVAMAMCVVYIWHLHPFGWAVFDLSYLYILIALLLPLCFIWKPAYKTARGHNVPWYDILLILLSFGIPLYIVLMEKQMMWGWDVKAPTTATVLAAILWVIAIEGARRAAGLPFALFTLLISLYPLYAWIMPGPLWAKSYSVSRVINFHFFGHEGFVGSPMHVYGRIFLGYMVFAMAIQASGAGKFFNDLAHALLGRTRAGSAKTAIIASGLFGSISGAPTANVFVTGTFTIPAMKKEGFPAHFAAAVETCASAGGVYMPPVMGAIAFLMAEFLGIPYVKVCLAAIVPALLYYLVLFTQVDAYAARTKMVPPQANADDRPKVMHVLLDNFPILVSFFVLCYVLFVMYWETWAPWIATAVMLALAMSRKKTRLSLRGFLALLQDTGRVLGELIAIFAPVGLIIASFTLTGVAYSLPYTLTALAGGNLNVMLIVGAMTCFVLGMGITASAIYIFLAIVLCPSLIHAGLDEMGVHLFVLYCAMWSTITPPVAITAFCAAGLAGASPMRTGFQAMRLGVAKYLLPFFFVLRPALILRGDMMDSLWAIPTCD